MPIKPKVYLTITLTRKSVDREGSEFKNIEKLTTFMQSEYYKVLIMMKKNKIGLLFVVVSTININETIFFVQYVANN